MFWSIGSTLIYFREISVSPPDSIFQKDEFQQLQTWNIHLEDTYIFLSGVQTKKCSAYKFCEIKFIFPECSRSISQSCETVILKSFSYLELIKGTQLWSYRSQYFTNISYNIFNYIPFMPWFQSAVNMKTKSKWLRKQRKDLYVIFGCTQVKYSIKCLYL